MTKRNYFLDFWKFIAAIGVIMVHVPYGGKLGATLACVGNWGVSFFFLISGYMCFGDREKVCGKIARRFRRNGIITVISVAVYLLFTYIESRMNHTDVLLKLQLKKPVTYIRMIFLGDFEFFYGSAFWFLVALLYGYILFYLIARFSLRKLAYILLPIFLILRITVETCVSSFGWNWHWSGNALVGAIPMMLVGYVIADRKDRLMKIPAAVLIILSVFTAVLMFITVNYRVGRYDISQPFKILCSSLVFILGIKKPSWYIIKPVAFLGRTISLYIYITHFMLIVIIANIMQRTRVYYWQLPPAVIIASILVSLVIFGVEVLIKRLIRKKTEPVAAGSGQ